LIKHQVADAHDDAERIRREAQAQALRILEEARAEADRLQSEARARGFEAGNQEWTERILELTAARQRLLDDNRERLLKLSIKLAQKILGHELEARPEALGDLVLKAVRGLPQQGKVQIRVRPADLETLRAQRSRLLAELGQRVEIDLREDPTIVEGGCVIETPVGIIDARLETQLRVLERILLQGKA
jgi:flagellar biosynthesis/type III secretory pathway protein FliH